MAIGALKTSINIEKIVRIIYVSRPYRLTSFMQQSERERRNREVSKSVIITCVKNNSS
jgi:hypothetical protein